MKIWNQLFFEGTMSHNSEYSPTCQRYVPSDINRANQLSHCHDDTTCCLSKPFVAIEGEATKIRLISFCVVRLDLQNE